MKSWAPATRVYLRDAGEGGRSAVRSGQGRFSPKSSPSSWAPSLIAKRPGDRVKPDRRNAPCLLRILIGGAPVGRADRGMGSGGTFNY